MNRGGGGGSSPAAATNYLICTNCRKVLRKDKRIRVSQPLTRGPSAFIPEKEVAQANTSDERTNFLVEEYSTSGRLDNITQVMSLHTQYLESFLRSQFYMLRMDGPLPLPHRHYIAIMAAARHQCSYLINMHVDEFLKTGGIAEWLNGLKYVPQRLKNLNEINKLLAHRPWLITKEHIQIVGSLSELEALMERMKMLQEEREDGDTSQEEMTTRFEKETKESLFVVSGDTFHSFPHSDFEDDMIITSDVSRYIEDPGFGYEDFARRGEEHLPTFRAQDYTWENHGFSLVNRLYSDIGHLLDEKFRMVYSLTYNTMATHEDVDTTMLRRALFNYVHCMFGIRYDDYDYGEVNQLLERSLKVYIKTVTCYPERTTKRMYDSYWRQFKHSEKVHVNLLLMEARMQAELLYALRAITRHLT
ncbi:sestrin-3 isoform X2 [Pipistrellus kuhlii]|uniref:sestrin-3 isoform X2 n=1 Tax=Pipistrellus kuhlii TaxID=59472 RepID=UPI001E270798|nr:sestrin-3 isoform X2 [Pipistrellus kuhlii]